MYRKKIWLVTAFVIAMVFASAALAVTSVRSADKHLKQARIAHELLEKHLELSVHSYRLFKQLTDEIVLGHGANQSIVRNKRGVIKDLFARIRELEWKQRLSLGERATLNSVEDTDDLENLIEAIIQDFETVLRSTDLLRRREGIDTILEDRIDIGFREAVNAALERQRRVVGKMESQVQTLHSRLVGLSAILALGALLAGWLGSQILVRGIARPLRSLQDGAVRLANGDLSYRVARGFDDEFDDMAAAFNSMAETLERQHAALLDQRRELELAVADRTEEISRAHGALKKADEVRRQFFADVSHELRTPITVIRGESQVALRASSRNIEDYRESLQAILDQSVALSRLVEDMLFIARTDAQGMRLSRRQTDLLSLIEDVARDMRQTAALKGIDITVGSQSAEVTALTDPDRIRQLALILLENSVRYSPENTAIQIELGMSSREIQIVFIDQGYGIDPKDLPHVFERFYRAHAESHREIAGTGLGLAIAKAIVEAHGGEITAQPNNGGGTQFVVSLPHGSWHAHSSD